MDIHMNDDRIESIAQLQAFLEGVDGTVTFRPETKGNTNKQKMYEWIGRTLGKFRYASVEKRERGIILSYLEVMTKLSRIQLKRLCRRKKERGTLHVVTEGRHSFPVRYGTDDIARLIETDNAHGRIAGEATKRIMEREHAVFDKKAFLRIGGISVSHLYRLRKSSRQYISGVLHVEKTRATAVNIGIRRKPAPFGLPGYVRVDSVHQGDLDKEKGVYHINLVDEVTQWEVVGCVEGISEEFLRPLLDELLAAFPFRIRGFHSDNGSEYINEVVAQLLQKLSIEQTKSRSRHTNDNALVEGKNASRVRKHMGYTHIPKRYARSIMGFYREHLNVYCNFHRPCGFATSYIDRRGKETKRYDAYRTPFEKLCSIPQWETYLREGVTAVSLRVLAEQESDNECGKKLQEAKQKLFKTFAR
jgi:hypothetical protein